MEKKAVCCREVKKFKSDQRKRSPENSNMKFLSTIREGKGKKQDSQVGGIKTNVDN